MHGESPVNEAGQNNTAALSDEVRKTLDFILTLLERDGTIYQAPGSTHEEVAGASVSATHLLWIAGMLREGLIHAGEPDPGSMIVRVQRTQKATA